MQGALTAWLIKFGTEWVKGTEIHTVTKGNTRQLEKAGYIEFFRPYGDSVVSWRITQKGLGYIKGDNDE